MNIWYGAKKIRTHEIEIQLANPGKVKAISITNAATSRLEIYARENLTSTENLVAKQNFEPDFYGKTEKGGLRNWRKSPHHFHQTKVLWSGDFDPEMREKSWHILNLKCVQINRIKMELSRLDFLL